MGAESVSDCSICGGQGQLAFWGRWLAQSYWHCLECRGVFVAAVDRLPLAAERACYRNHQNDPADPAYRRFLQPAFAAVVGVVKAGDAGLDFGCGPGPALAALLTEAGYEMSLYDPMFVPDETIWQRRYDFITMTEVAEHLHDPAGVLAKIYRLINPGGTLVVMTKQLVSRELFGAWYYKNDPTHVAFFSHDTWPKILGGAKTPGSWSVRGADVVVFKKN